MTLNAWTTPPPPPPPNPLPPPPATTTTSASVTVPLDTVSDPDAVKYLTSYPPGFGATNVPDGFDTAIEVLVTVPVLYLIQTIPFPPDAAPTSLEPPAPPPPPVYAVPLSPDPEFASGEGLK